LIFKVFINCNSNCLIENLTFPLISKYLLVLEGQLKNKKLVMKSHRTASGLHGALHYPSPTVNGREV
jgi:hypothetical protein